MNSIGLNIKIPKETIIKLKEMEKKEIVVKFNGGREVWGELKSWDKTMNLVLDNTKEVTGLEDSKETTRDLGFIIVKGSQIQSIVLKDGFITIDNPYLEQ